MHQAGFKKDSPIKRIVMRGMRSRGGYHEEQYFDQSIGDILRHDVCKINCRVISPELERDLKAYLAERSDRVVNAPFDPVMFEITDVACNKGESVAWLAGYYGIAEDEVAVYGDAETTSPCSSVSATATRPKNASDAAKAAASATIGNCMVHAVPKHMLATMRKQNSRTIIE